MVNFICIKCNKNFDKKSHYLVHINRKYPCIQVINESIINPTQFKIHPILQEKIQTPEQKNDRSPHCQPKAHQKRSAARRKI